MNVRTIQNLNYSGQESKFFLLLLLFAIYDLDTPVTLKQGQQGHQTWYELADLKQGYNNAKSEKPCLNSP